MKYKGIVPVEVAGYRNVRIWTRDHSEKPDGFRWWSVINDDHDEEDFLPWHGDSTIEG